MSARVVVFGVDGLTFRVLHPLMQQEKLPHFRLLQQQGCEAILESKYPPITPPAWISLSTGLKPANHGVYDFWDFGEQQGAAPPRPPKLLTRRKGGKAIWNILSEFGKQVLIVNIPMTYPPEPVNGFMVSGYMTPGINTQFTYPHSFQADLLRTVPNYEIDLPLEDKTIVAGKRKWRVLDATLRMTERRIELIEYMLQEKPWDFCFLGFVGADRIQHRLWDEIIALDPRTCEYYQLLDDELGRIMDRLGPDDSLFVVSDHGFQGASRSFEINEYLYSKGLVALTNHSQARRERDRRKNVLKHTLKQIGLLGLAKRAWRTRNALKSEQQDNIEAYDPHILKISNIAWEKTLAFVPSSSGFGSGYADIFLSPAMAVEEIVALRTALLHETDPATGKMLLEAAYTTEVFGIGPYAPGEPHLLLLPQEGITFRRGLGNPRFWDDATMTHDPGRRSGVHQKDGVLYAYGGAFKQGFKAPPAEVYDLVPTILQSMNLPLPTPCDGRILEELFIDQKKLQESDSIHSENNSVTLTKLKKLLEA
ncbi:nucleotide pyrophosphatase [Reticulibacter mediterranei]|uniref:Nucleotide pyrophosphatase n=1 Tax=Reticulibacter mediterranei TaxID=2778369 RepID=A0A8J3II45_9CHLR|nr:alkaline phosphatase family protein [Reticulibacter mediterranei]GHO91872.1 nucleotide pyrophosphatase [Reticulibacter mediterranei]